MRNTRALLILTFGLSAVARSTTAQAPPATSFQSSTPVPITQMPANAEPSFEVATVKPSDTTTAHGKGLRIEGRHVIAFNMSVQDLLVYAYGLQVRQIVNGPQAIMASKFDVDGVPDVAGHPNRVQSRLLFQRLLVSRFKLKFHYEPRILPVYGIQVAGSGPRLALTTRKPGEATNFSYTCPPALTVRNYSMSDFAKGMQDAFMDRPVVDQTGLKDCYDFDLKWTVDDSQTYCTSRGGSDDPNAPPGLYTAIQEQLGLKLVSTKDSVQTMVIDQLEMPSEN